ncbi:TIGR00730 family Rossman fold protein [Undibacterium fentianense]|uniref:Cytokinin riboside 5'-monophosphate phosphoribohydrolase n=1 Tax=Undibacterium fentianense TaxID=2828728 RepID=A0A941IB78_9BURK|nr:TIGR00730 family Rossman fold protein [Undibacterium fentianense]MBR7798739.1 TIGR00730 family Rossman fold protein [Undibacterium fentianense]
MRSICVYCGSAKGNSPAFHLAALGMAQQLVSNKIELVYGGGDVGIMKIIADEVLRLGGHVTGVIPKALLDREVGHNNLNQLHVVANMHERKAMMAELSDGFIALPGGIGTLEELFEMFTWLQLGFHHKPLGLLNVDGFYDQLLQFLDHAVQSGFLKPEHNALLIKETDSSLLIRRMQHFEEAVNSKYGLNS